MPDKIMLFDTTLRDGQLSAATRLTEGERIDTALALEEAGVDVIEVSFPGMHAEDIASTRLLARQIRGSVLCCLAGMDREHIDLAAGALSQCQSTRLHIYLDAKRSRSAADPAAGREEVLRSVTETVAYARNLADEVEFSPQDATRLDFDALVDLIQAALIGGAGVINVSDTTGTASPEEVHNLFQRLFDRVPGLDEAIVSLHGHDHMGRASENAIAAVDAGARQIEGTINGIGPAGGNTDLVSVARDLEAKGRSLGVYMGADLGRLQRLAQKLEQ